jgi:hypothetical protein
LQVLEQLRRYATLLLLQQTTEQTTQSHFLRVLKQKPVICQSTRTRLALGLATGCQAAEGFAAQILKSLKKLTSLTAGSALVNKEKAFGSSTIKVFAKLSGNVAC